MLIRLNVVLLLVIFSSSAVSAPRQAHLPLTSGLPPLPDLPLNAGVRYAGSPPLEYPSRVTLGGSPLFSLSGALRDVPYAVPQPFHEWDVNHANGPSAFDCPDGFSLTADNTCILVEYRRPEESCPYGTFRGKSHHGCVQIDSVPPDRTCPSGFQYFMRGCIRRTQAPPLLTCAPGYSQLEDACYSISSIAPQIHCPPGFGLREEIPEDETATANDVNGIPSMHVCYKEHLSPPIFTCPDGRSVKGAFPEPEGPPAVPIPLCFHSVVRPPMNVCPEGFQLVSQKQMELALENGNSPVLSINETDDDDDDDEEEAEDSPTKNLQCVKIVEYPGKLVCKTGYKLTWSTDPSSEPFSIDRLKCVVNPSEILRKSWTPAVAVKAVFGHSEKSWQSNNKTKTLSEPNSEATTSEVVSEANSEATISEASFQPTSDVRSVRPSEAAGAAGFDVHKDSWFQRQPVRSGVEMVEFAATLDESPRSEKITVFTNPDGLRTLRREKIDFSDVISGEYGRVKTSTQTKVGSKKGKRRGYHYYYDTLSNSEESQSTFGRRLTSADAKRASLIDTVAPIIVFQRESCNNEASIVWKRAVNQTTGRGVPGFPFLPTNSQKDFLLQPYCREVQVVKSSLECSNTARVECRNSQEFVIEKSPLEESTDRRRRTLRATTGLMPARLTPDNCVEHLHGTAVCVETELQVPALPSCPPKSVLHSRGIAPDENFERLLCIEEEVVPALLECPFGVGTIGEATGRCDVLVTTPIDAICPEGYTRGRQDLGAFGNYLYSRMNKRPLSLLPEPSGGTAGICELIEYADYQITCPAGYQREGPKNNANACLAEKPIPPSIVCPPGFMVSPAAAVAADMAQLDDLKACQKTVEVAPTIVSYPLDEIPASPSGHIDGATATACVLTKDHKLSCGMERKYHGAVDLPRQMKKGEAFKAKADLKGRKYIEKYSHS